MKQIFTILLLFASVIGSFAQHTISGIVTDEKNAPLPGVTVYVMSLAKGTVTDDNGKYELNNMPSGELQLQFSFVGRANVIRYTKLQKSDLQLNIVLNPSAIETEEVLVTSGYNNTQHENAVKIDVLKMQNNTNLISANLCESLAKIPGVDLITKGSGVAKPVIRGLSRDNILSLNNGMRFENFQYSDHHPLGIDEYDVENVEIIKGPASLLYGSDAVGGVLNFLKEKPASVGSFVADYNFKYLSVSQGISNNVGIKAAGSHFFGGLRAGFKSAADYLQGDGDFVPNSRMKEQAFHANAGYNNSWSSLKLFYDYNSEKLGLVEPEAVAETTERGREVGLMFEQITSNMVSSQNKIFVGDYTIEANASWQNAVLAHAQNNDLVELEMALRTLTYELKVHLPSGKNAEYIIGAQGISQQYSNINDRETLLLPKASVDSYAAFALLQYTFFDKLNVQTGLRYDQKQIQTNSIGQLHEESFRAAISRDYGSLSGSVGATYQPSEQFLLRYNFAAAFRTPNLAELTANGPHEEVYEKGDASLIPQKALENDLSMHFHSANITFDLAGYFNRINNFIYRAPSSAPDVDGLPVYQFRQDNAQIYGYELGFHIHPNSSKWLHWQTSYSKVIGQKIAGGYLATMPADKFRSELKCELEKWHSLSDLFFKLEWQYAFKQTKTADNEESTPAYSLIDLGIGGNFRSLSVGVELQNIFDVKYIDHLSTLKEVGFFNPGRNLALSVRYRFDTKK